MTFPPLPVLALAAASLARAAAAQPTDADPNLVDRGKYLATAGDCVACHSANMAGGKPIASPIGDIYAPNITPDPGTGIGSWTLAQFSDTLRKGRTPDGHLYPAMPYTSYTGLGDGEIAALYSYFMLGVDPVSNVPPETDLSFPFVRPAMIAWNALFLDEGHSVGAVDVEGDNLERGRLLVESLGHCTGCHTPRGDLMQQESGRHLGGAMVSGWWAPNITPDPSGIGGWSDELLATFLMTGHTDVAVAGGEMGTVVSRSLSHLPEDDIGAIVAYLRAVPAVASDEVPQPESAPPAAIQVASVEPADETGWQAMLGHDTDDGAILYQSACASCHGMDGMGSADLAHPSLREVQGVRAPQGATLVQVIAHGVDRTVGDTTRFMPGFRDSLTDAQIASLANYVRTDFGGIGSDVTATNVQAILAGTSGTPWIIANAKWLAILALVFGAALLLAIAWWTVRWLRRSGTA